MTLKILCLIKFCFFTYVSSKYIEIKDLQSDTIQSQWINGFDGKQLQLCNSNQNSNSIGYEKSLQNIWLKRTYQIPKTNKLYVYFELYLSGIWNNQEIQILSNQVIVYTKIITLNDENRNCNKKFIYSEHINFILNQQINEFVLEIKVNNINIGLYVQNIVILQQTQIGRNEFIPYFGFIPICGNSGQLNNDYRCSCEPELVQQNTQCLGNCDTNYLYNSQSNECSLRLYCNNCGQKNEVLSCNSNTFVYTHPTTYENDCVVTCPEDYIGDIISKNCIRMADYLSQNQNNGFPVNHYFFYKSIDDFFHFYNHNDFKINLISIPLRINEKPFLYLNEQFVVGSFEIFQSQVIELISIVQQSQYKLLFRGIAHFIDFYPITLNVFINQKQINYDINQILISNINLQNQALQDYQIQFEFIWERESDISIISNIIRFEIEQPLQNQQYIGYFYLDNIHLYQFECITNCNNCFNSIVCPPCTNPDNKNPKDCTCNIGYSMQNDICIQCPTYCNQCTIPNICDGCNLQTKRLNPPDCNQCPQQYYLQINVDNCQSCINGCLICNNNIECIQCLNGYFRDNQNKCLIQCIDGYFNDSTNINDPKCSLCDVNCKTCKDLSTKCTSCQVGQALLIDYCLICQQGYYLDNQQCIQCINGCQQCNKFICLICNDSYYYQSQTNQCLNTCLDGYYGNVQTRTCDLCDINCSTCSDSTSKDCLTCNNGKVLNLITLYSGDCQLTCAIGYYKNNNYCSKCWKGCAKCVDSTSACITCSQSFYRLLSSGLCYDKCPDGYYKNNNGYYCSPCSASCKTCYSGTETNCYSCNPSLALFQNTCIPNCYSGYFNYNNVCTLCAPNCKSCFGILPNQCFICSYGFYFLNFQCYDKCPTYFKPIRPQYVCQCAQTNCANCLDTQFILNNQCYNICPQGYYGYNKLCIQCDLSCKTCFKDDDQSCLTCNIGLYYYNYQCVQQCTGNTYPDNIERVCKDCNLQCLSCNGPDENQCTSCFDNFLLTQQGICDVSCPFGQYTVLSEKKCYYCDPKCLSCFGPSDKQCLTCSNYFYLFQCVDSCPDGFTKSINSMSCEPDFSIVIAQCAYQCSTCILTARFCTNCASNRAANAPNCDCEFGYLDDGVSSTCKSCSNKCLSCVGVPDNCLKCKGDRILPNCNCPSFFYDDGTSVNCIKCQDNCRVCNDTECLICLGDRINLPQCICPDGYFEAYQYYCQQCSLRCLTCSGTMNLCDQCSDIRILLPICLCPVGFFENNNMECQQCEPSCHDCNQTGCLTCSGNRIGPFNGDCVCDTLGIDRIKVGSSYCTDCFIGVPSFVLNDDLTGFTFDFGGQVLINTNVQVDLCEVFFDHNTLQKLGTNPVCDNNFNVIFGDNPNIFVDDKLQLNSNFLLPGCLYNFKYILPMPLTISNFINVDLIKPIVQMKQLIEPNICDYIIFEFEKLFYNGKQPVKVISWNSIFPQDNKIDQILQQFTLNSSTFVIFPPKIFQANIQYQFSVTIESFAKLQNTISFQFIAVQFSIIKFQPTISQFQFFRFDTIYIPGKLNYINCIEQTPPNQTLYYEIKVAMSGHSSVEGKLTDNLTDGFEKLVDVGFQPYYFELGSYSLIYKTKLYRPDYNISYINEFDVYIKPYDPILNILGGDRMVGYKSDLFINLTIYDKDQEYLNQQIFDCKWQCTDIINETACINQQNEKINFTNQYNQYLPSFTFKPYSVVIIEVFINKFYSTHSTKVTLQFIEIDLQQLIVYGNDQNKTHNYYDEFLFQLIYPGINPDLLMYAGAVIYNQIVQSTFQFYYLEFKFKLINYFINFNVPHNKVKLRLSVYDPRFIMPSINTQILIMNIPPQNCSLQIQMSDNFVEFLDKIKINVSGCYDKDQPLLYSLLLFPNQSIYDKEQQTTIYYNYLLLVPPQKQQFFNLTLPYNNHQDSLLLINIVDSNDGITNITQKIHIKKYYNITQDTINDYSKYWNTQDDYLIGYRILAERLSKYDGIEQEKQKLLDKLINFDKNQSLLSNQTESLYHSLSCIIGSNQTLLITYDNQLLIQINYRIHIAYQSLLQYQSLQSVTILNSKQHIDKQNYIKQYFSFMNILSSYIKYRLLINQTCFDIRNYYQLIIEQLQSVSVANEPLYQLLFNSVNLNFGVVTAKIANEIINSLGNVGNNISIDIFKYSLIRYYDNPFYQEQGFPKNSSGYQAVDPKLIEQLLRNQNTKLQQPIRYKFPIPHKLKQNTSLQCITEIDQNKWNASICKTIEKNNEIICECEQLNPTSLMEQYDYLIDKAEQIYSLDVLQLMTSFPFYKTVIFYFYLSITSGYIALVIWGMRVDHIMYEKIAVEKQQEAEQLAKIEEDKKHLQQQETQKVTEKELNQPIIALEAYSGRTIFSRINLRVNLNRLINHYSKNTSIKIVEKTDIIDSGKQEQKEITQNDPFSKIQLQTSLSSQTNLYNPRTFRSPKTLNSTRSLRGKRQHFIQKQVSILKAYFEYLKYFHQILSIVYRDDSEKPRGLRASIVYTSILGSLAVLFIFNQPNNLNFTIMLAALTAPLNKIYQLILEKLLSSNKQSIRIIGAILMIIVGGLMSYTMLAGLVLKESINIANQWSFIFIGTFCLDNIIYSPIILFIKYFIHMRDYKIQFIQTIIDKIFDVKAKKYLRLKIYK